MTATAIVVTIVVIQRLSELRLASRNYAWSMKHGGAEVGGAHYRLFVVLHCSWLVSILVESLVRNPPITAWWPLFLGVIAAAQFLRYWTITTLGYRWNTRIIVFADESAINSGPFRYLKHPNYVAVAAEIFFIPALLGAWYSAVLFSILNALLLLLIRIPMEERALREAGARSRRESSTGSELHETEKH